MAQEARAIQFGLDHGLTLIDTAEMYADGGAESSGPSHSRQAGRGLSGVQGLPAERRGQKAVTACENSLRRLQTDVIDLYLLHWRGNIPWPIP
ncbi:aldo/keto reductase [Sodalis ligni]|uniref:aldo/keto reductase n=1 Tax=Sodalis ligni TaxID=2697027 RepID=UPI00209777FB|nr:aldo/keto reductase [Sodalis ligni]